MANFHPSGSLTPERILMTDHEGHSLTKCKIWPKRVVRRQMTYFWNFAIRFIFRERLQLETWN